MVQYRMNWYKVWLGLLASVSLDIANANVDVCGSHFAKELLQLNND